MSFYTLFERYLSLNTFVVRFVVASSLVCCLWERRVEFQTDLLVKDAHFGDDRKARTISRLGWRSFVFYTAVKWNRWLSDCCRPTWSCTSSQVQPEATLRTNFTIESVQKKDATLWSSGRGKGNGRRPTVGRVESAIFDYHLQLFIAPSQQNNRLQRFLAL